MNKYTRKYYINGVETKLSTLLKYIEITLTHGTTQLKELNIEFKDEKV